MLKITVAQRGARTHDPEMSHDLPTVLAGQVVNAGLNKQTHNESIDTF